MVDEIVREYLPLNTDINSLDQYQLNKIEWLDSLKGYSNNSKKSYWSDIENKVHDIEKALNKDLYMFTKVEIENIIKSISTISFQTIQRVFSCISNYIEYTVDIGKNYVGNICNSIVLSDIIGVNENALKESYVPLLEYLDFIGDLKCSDVDKMIVVLLRYGVSIKDITELKLADIDRENKVINIRSNNTKLPVDNLFFMMLERCNNCNIYEIPKKVEVINNRTGEINVHYRTTTKEYRNTEYVIKPTIKMESDSLTSSSLYSRLLQASKKSDINPINSNIVNNMRKYDLLYEAYNKHGEVTNEDVKNVLTILEGEMQNNVYSRKYTLKNTFEVLSGISVIIKR